MRLLTEETERIIRKESGRTLRELGEMEFRSYSPEPESPINEAASYKLPVRSCKWYDIRRYF